MCRVCVCGVRFHLKEYPDYKYQPRKRPATTGAGGHDTSAGTPPRSGLRRPVVKRLCTRRGRKRKSTLVPRCETPLSTAGSELSEIAESYLSSDWSVGGNDWEEEEEDIDITGSEVPTYESVYKPTDHIWSFPRVVQPSTLSPPVRSQFVPKESVSPVFSAGCGRGYSGVEGFDWLADYITPEVVDLLADDWFVTADNICLRDVVVM